MARETLIRQNTDPDLSLGKIALNAWGVDSMRNQPVVVVNFVGPDHRLPLPDPLGDTYITQTAVMTARRGEVIICNKLIPGLEEYYRNLGVVPEGAVIHQVAPRKDDSAPFGYPATDPIANIDASGYKFNPYPALGNMVLFSSFMSPGFRRNAHRIGLQTLRMPDSIATNHKGIFRDNAETFNYPVLPGINISANEQVSDAVRFGQQFETGVWVKFATGSGGDLVTYVPGISRGSLLEARNGLRNAVSQSFRNGRFSLKFDRFWPEEQFTPKGFPLVIEADARNLGEVVLNASTQMISYYWGGVEGFASAAQVTTESGDYLGSKYLTREELGNVADIELLDRYISGAAKYNREKFGFVGIQGPDLFVIKRPNGDRQMFFVELNSRPIVSTPPEIVARKMGKSRWLNINCYTDTDMTKIGDFISLIGDDLARGRDPRGLVIPQSFRTLVYGDDSMIASPNFKALILGDSDVNIQSIVMGLIQQGIRFSPD